MLRWLALLLFAAPALAQSPSVVLHWTASLTPGARISIYRAHNSCAGPFAKIANVAGSPYSDSLVIVGATYAYQVTATLNGQESAPSNCVILTIASPAVVLQSPTGLSAAQTQ